MFCRFCGKKLDENSQFCPFCGKNVKNACNVHNKKGGRKSFILIVAVTAVIALVLAVVIFVLVKKKEVTNVSASLENSKEQKEEIEPPKTETTSLPSLSPTPTSPAPAVVSLPTSSPTPIDFTPPSTESDTVEVEDSNSRNRMMNAYRELLQKVHDNPEDYVTLENPKDIEGCDFTIYDLNQDGMDELIITLTNTVDGARSTDVWTYHGETDQVEEMDGFKRYWQYFSNGVIKDSSSHNQKVFGSALWPYTLKRYNKFTKKLEAFASAYCVDKEWGSASGEYKESLDSDGDGVLYYFELNGTTHGPLTREEYLSYANQFIPEELSVDFKWTAITNENIANVK